MARPLKQLYEISVTSPVEAEEPIAAMLQHVLGVPSNVYTDVQKNIARCRAYIPNPLTKAQTSQIQACLTDLKSLGLFARTPVLRQKKLPPENWAESWKRHFKALRISGKLLIKPSWNKTRPLKNEAVVILDPGLSFGTGNHPTTGFCLEILANKRSSAPQNFLDAGCGSGILAIAAAKLGYQPVEAFDFDPEAVRIAAQNAEANNVAIKTSRKDLTKCSLPKQFDVVCANLIDDLLIQSAPKLAAAVKPGGTLVLAGILIRQYPAVRKTFENLGLRQTAARTKNEWRSGAFSSPARKSGNPL